MTKPKDFRTAFCTQVDCADGAFERTLFRCGLYRHALPLAGLIKRLSPRFFREDLEFIRWVGGDTCLAEVEEDIERFEYGNRVRQHWLRTGFRMHLNPARLTRIARLCMGV